MIGKQHTLWIAQSMQAKQYKQRVHEYKEKFQSIPPSALTLSCTLPKAPSPTMNTTLFALHCNVGTVLTTATFVTPALKDTR